MIGYGRKQKLDLCLFGYPNVNHEETQSVISQEIKIPAGIIVMVWGK